MLKAVILDMDGTLVDTEIVHYYVIRDILKRELGIDMEMQEYLQYCGSPDQQMWPMILEEAGTEAVRLLTGKRKMQAEEMSAEALIASLSADLEQMHWDEYDEYIVENGIQEFPGVKELLSALRQEGIRLAVATGSLNRIVEKNLEILGIEELIEATATSEDVKEGKPAPDVFLHAALQLGVEPSECLVIEDAGNGLLAAKRAGMACAGFDGSKLPSDMTLAPVVIKDYREVKPENLREYYEIQKGGSLP